MALGVDSRHENVNDSVSAPWFLRGLYLLQSLQPLKAQHSFLASYHGCQKVIIDKNIAILGKILLQLLDLWLTWYDLRALAR